MKPGNVRVHMQYPWKFPDCSYYTNILDFPPASIDFVNYSRLSNKKPIGVIGSTKAFESTRKIKNIIRKVLQILRIPNLTLTRNSSADVIHCAHCLSLNRKSWVVDTEIYDRVSAIGSIAYSRIGKWIIKSRLESKYCKRIICWSEDCKRTFERAFPNSKKIKDKLEVVHFALPVPKYKKIPHKNIRILFAARWFDSKGGLQTLEVFDRLTKKFKNVECLYACDAPSHVRKKYESNKRIKLLGLIPQEKLFNEVYPSCDIFFYPGFGDSYGVAVPEAMAFQLPTVSTRTFAKEELIEDGKTGFLVDLPKSWTGYWCMDEVVLKEFVDKTALLVKDASLRKKMGAVARKEVVSGKFSIKKRNEQLKRIYREASQ